MVLLVEAVTAEAALLVMAEQAIPHPRPHLKVTMVEMEQLLHPALDQVVAVALGKVVQMQPIETEPLVVLVCYPRSQDHQ